MAISKLEQDELQNGYATIESAHAIIGVGTVKTVAIRGGTHPKMRLLRHTDETTMATAEGFTGAFSFVLPLVDTTGGLVVDVIHDTGVIAGRSGAQVTLGAAEPISAQAAATDDPIFEADEDVIIQSQTANGAAGDVALAVLKFEVVN